MPAPPEQAWTGGPPSSRKILYYLVFSGLGALGGFRIYASGFKAAGFRLSKGFLGLWGWEYRGCRDQTVKDPRHHTAGRRRTLGLLPPVSFSGGVLFACVCVCCQQAAESSHKGHVWSLGRPEFLELNSSGLPQSWRRMVGFRDRVTDIRISAASSVAWDARLENGYLICHQYTMIYYSIIYHIILHIIIVYNVMLYYITLFGLEVLGAEGAVKPGKPVARAALDILILIMLIIVLLDIWGSNNSHTNTITIY